MTCYRFLRAHLECSDLPDVATMDERSRLVAHEYTHTLAVELWAEPWLAPCPKGVNDAAEFEPAR